MAHGKARHTDYAQPQLLRTRRRRGEHNDRFDPRFVNETVTKPDGFENTPLFREDSRLQNCVDVRETEEHPAIRQA